MFCEKCGKQNSDGARFCEHCGAPMPAAPAAAPVVNPIAAEESGAGIGSMIADLCRKNKLIVPVAAVVAVIAIVLTLFLNAQGKKVSINRYMKVEVTGYNGFGKLDYEMDGISLGMRALGDKKCNAYGSFDPTKVTEEEMEALKKKYPETRTKAVGEFLETVHVNLELPEGKNNRTLSNGDVIKFSIAYDEAMAKKLGMTIENATYEYKVEGLGEMATFDVLENFTYVTEGYDGVGSGKLVCTKSGTYHVGDITFETDVESYYLHYTDKNGNTRSISVYIDGNTYNISNGEVITLRVNMDENALASSGVKLTGLTKEITVSNLQSYEEVNLLDKVHVEFSGLTGSGRGKPVIEPSIITVGGVEFNFEENYFKKGNETGYIYLNLSKSSSLSNGDVIEVYFSFNERDLARFGMKMPETRMEVTVSGLATYATDVSQFGENANELVSAGQIIVNDYLNDNWSSAVHNSWRDFTDQYVGDDMGLYAMVLTTAKSTTASTKNTLWLIYRVTLQDNALEVPTYYYFAVSERNLAINGDNTILETNTSKTKYIGYTSYQDLFKARIDSYNLNIFEKFLMEDDEPAPVEPTPEEPEVTEPEEPEVTEPEEPEVTEPEEPEVTEPVETEPEVTEPVETAPADPAE